MMVKNNSYIKGDETTRSFTGHQFESMDDKSKLDIL